MRPAAPFMQKIRVGLRPRRGRPRPPPGRLSTQVLFPAVTRRTKCPPGASNKNCAVDLTVHFKGASRAHGPGREVREPHPGQPSALQRPFWGPCNPHPSTTPACSRPPPPAAPRPRAPLPTAPPAARSFLGSGCGGTEPPTPPFTAELSFGEADVSASGWPRNPSRSAAYFYFPVLGPLLSCQDLIKAQPAPADSPGPGSGSQ